MHFGNSCREKSLLAKCESLSNSPFKSGSHYSKFCESNVNVISPKNYTDLNVPETKL